MVQPQLVDYINAQFKLGISRDAVKASLVGAGWSAIDVEDTLKKAEEKPAAAAPASSASPAPASARPADGPTIRVSDLISVPQGASSFSTKDAASKGDPKKPAAAATPASMSSGGKKAALATEVVLGVLVLGLAAGAFILFLQNQDLTSKIGALNNTSAGVTSQLSSLQNGFNTATAQTAALTMQVDELKTNLSFYVLRPGGSAGPQPVSVTGVVSGGGKSPYLITTSYGAKISVENSKDVNVISFLGPLVGTSTMISGTYLPGTPAITVVPPRPAASTTTGTSTAPTASSTTSTSK